MAAVVLAGLLGLGAIGCASSTSPSSGSPAATDAVGPSDASSGIDEPVEQESPVGVLPTLAPIADSVKASPACDRAYQAWMKWWQDSVDNLDPDNPDASPTGGPAGDPDRIERAVFDKCSLIDIAAANRDHPVTLDADEGPVPFIDDDVILFLAGTCDDDVAVVGDSALCQALPSPAP
ncbi:MAG TPA: hypothetical protein VLR93_07030 [Patescibacteria group bacterium]|nr:hypothetical protein [Patescibacteria group bacterium]